MSNYFEDSYEEEPGDDYPDSPYIGISKGHKAPRASRHSYVYDPMSSRPYRVEAQIQPHAKGAELAIANWRPEQLYEFQTTMSMIGPPFGFGPSTRFVPYMADGPTIRAYKRVLTYANQIGLTSDEALNEIVSMSMAGGFGEQGPSRQPRVRGGNVYEVRVDDPASIRAAADRVGQAVYGRKANPDEEAAIIAAIQGAQREQQQKANNAEEQAHRRLFDAEVAANPISAPTGVSGFAGTDNVTAEYVLGVAQQLAGEYGLKITSHKRSPQKNRAVKGAKNSDHLWGGAVDLAGDPKQMAALAEWARQNMGPGKLFRWVGWGDKGHKDHVHLSFNKGKVPGATAAPVPSLPVTGAGGDTYLPPTTVETQNIDPEARIEEMLREMSPHEAKGHDLAHQFSVFAKLIGAA